MSSACGCDSAKQLAALQAKFDAWVAKARAATDKQREQNKDLEAEVAKLQKRLTGAPPSAAASSGGIADIVLEEAERRLRISEATHMSRVEVVAAYFGQPTKLLLSSGAAGAAAGAGAAVSTPVTNTVTASAAAAATAAAEKQRNRSERALLQANTLNMELSEKVADLQEALRGATGERDKLRERLEIKDNTIRALESQLVEATYAIQQHAFVAAAATSSASGSSAATAGKGGRSASSASPGSAHQGGRIDEQQQQHQQQQHLVAINELRDQLDDAHATIQELRLQIDHLNVTVKRAKQQAGATGTPTTPGTPAGAGTARPDAEHDELLDEIDQLRALNNNFRAKVASLEARCANDASSASTVVALRQQLATKARQIVELQEALAAAQQAQRASGASAPSASAVAMVTAGAPAATSSGNSGSTPRNAGGSAVPVSTGGGSTGVVFDPHIAHLRSTVLQLLISERDEVKARLVPVVAALLQMPQCDVRSIYSVHPEWKM